MTQYLFPERLLSETIEERKTYFKEYTAAHPAFEQAYNDLLDKIYNCTDNSVILVYGPTGAGKSKLIQKVNEKIYKDYLEQLKQDPGMFSTLMVEAIPPDSGNFDWKDFYYRALVEANEPAIDYKVNVEKYLSREKKVKEDSRAILKRSLENVLIYRKPKAFIIDEAQHITLTTSARNLKNQVNIIKSLANITKVPIVLCGTYDILTFRDLQGQTIRRGRDTHIKRYQAQNKDDLEAFINVLFAFQKHLPLQKEPDLVSHWDYFYSRTLGSVGTLKDWIYLTYSICLSNNPDLPSMEMDYFKKYEISAARALKMLSEAKLGEKRVENTTNSEENKLYLELGLTEEEAYFADKPAKKEIKKRNKLVGERNPRRDSVGVDELEEAQ
ncbi:AAA family ATPase [Bacillus sp. SJS]|uniref:AAA family ATPase n=1 Tax=Bacillus sp. SJS TaxID=1423321 RepID=UPI0004DCED69|nr:AAA family ATPase [Bacillus sp. SJS]KZZ84850.1 hypothetical protein AS29_007250 [Bacillus sp. SJS]